jgi:hypothetical protein
MKDEIEQMVDKVGLSKFLFMLAEICNEKAEHIQTNWQDRNLAKEWTADARAIEKIAAKIRTT